MRDRLITQQLNSFENPFDDINANILDPEQILNFWCNPFTIGGLKDFSEQKFRTQRLPIILQGSRGSGEDNNTEILLLPSPKREIKTEK